MSRYANMDHGEWLEASLKRKLTPFQHRVVNLIGIVGGGIYNTPIKWQTAEFEFGIRGVAVKWRADDFATWDFDQLTKLVFLAHEERIRVSLQPIAPKYLRVMFFPRLADGSMATRHPNLDEAIADFRTWYAPLDRFVKQKAAPASALEEAP